MKTYLLTGFICLLTLGIFAQTESNILNSESPPLFLEKAEFYHKEARKNDRKIAMSKKMLRYAKKVFEKDLERYHEYKEGGNEILIEQFRQKVEKEEQILKKLGEMIPDSRVSEDYYQKEADFREQYIESIGADSAKMADYYKLGVAQYKSNQCQKASESFDKVLEFKPDLIDAFQYQLQLAYWLESCDTTSNEWLALKSAKNIIEAFGNTDPSQLDEKRKELLLVGYEIMVFYSFNPTGEAGNYHCEDAKPWIEKIYAIEPNYNRVSAIVSYCD